MAPFPSPSPSPLPGLPSWSSKGPKVPLEPPLGLRRSPCAWKEPRSRPARGPSPPRSRPHRWTGWHRPHRRGRPWPSRQPPRYLPRHLPRHPPLPAPGARPAWHPARRPKGSPHQPLATRLHRQQLRLPCRRCTRRSNPLPLCRFPGWIPGNPLSPPSQPPRCRLASSPGSWATRKTRSRLPEHSLSRQRPRLDLCRPLRASKTRELRLARVRPLQRNPAQGRDPGGARFWRPPVPPPCLAPPPGRSWPTRGTSPLPPPINRWHLS